MEFHLLPVFTFLTLAAATTHAALPPELYWKSVLPGTPMPKAITDLLHPEWTEDKSTSVNVGKGGVHVNAGKGKPGGTTVNVGGPGGVNVHAGKGKPGGGTSVNVGGKGGGVSVNTGGHKGKPVHVYVSPFIYNYAASETQLHDNPNVALFFMEEDLHPGSKLKVHFTKSSNDVAFLPREVANGMPWGSNKVEEVLNQFSVKPGSAEAQNIKNTISECEEPGIKGEEKYCATSLESMVDFTTSKLGRNVEAISTDAGKETQLQEYRITAAVRKVGGEKAVVCHKQNYPYAVFYCHKTESTNAYFVPLEGADGSRVKAVAVCHTDTSEWNPKHLAFQVLKVKPGSVPVCHFLPEDHIAWVPK